MSAAQNGQKDAAGESDTTDSTEPHTDSDRVPDQADSRADFPGESA
jgi:hypothetical protein